MTDPLVLLHGPRRTAAAGGADRALAAGRRRLRRRRAVTTAAGVSAGVVFVAALAVAQGQAGPAGLAPAGTGERTAPATVAAPPASTAPAPLPTGSTLPGVPGVPPAVAARRPSAPGASSVPGAPVPRGRYVGTGSRTVRIADTTDAAACAGPQVKTVALSGFCTAMTGPASVRVGTPATFAFRMCRAAGLQPRTLTFTRSEVGIGANPSDQPGPDWQLHDPARSHAVTFTGGQCRTWTFEWMGQDSGGYAMRAGNYEVLGNVLADEWMTTNRTSTPAPPSSVFVDVS
jgi:hypothetical protein